MESIHKVWSTTSGDIEYTLLVKDNKFHIYRSDKPFMIYVDEMHKWIGASPKGVIMIDWLSLRDICELAEGQYK